MGMGTIVAEDSLLDDVPQLSDAIGQRRILGGDVEERPRLGYVTAAGIVIGSVIDRRVLLTAILREGGLDSGDPARFKLWIEIGSGAQRSELRSIDRDGGLVAMVRPDKRGTRINPSRLLHVDEPEVPVRDAVF